MAIIPTWMETAFKVIKSLNDGKKLQIHIGEAMACWTYLAFVEEIVIYEQIGLNTTEDKELVKMLDESLKVAKSHREQISEFMQNEGIPLPDRPQSKAKSDPRAVPVGVKFTDSELANAISINFVVASDMCAAAASQCLRTDIGLMFLHFQMDKLTLGYKIKNLMLKRGWLKIPPAYTPSGFPQQSN